MFFYQPSGGSKVNQSYGEVKLKQFFLNYVCRFRLLAKKYECKVVFIFLYFNVNIVKIKKNVKIFQQKNIELKIGSFI